MILPLLHVGGTSAPELIRQYTEALHAVREALAKLEACGPHARDYTQDADAVIDAVREHTQRVLSMRIVRDELEVLLASVVRQADERQRR